ncbi:MAG: CpsD/CapB family tyrosine-protein kinase [Kangiellaceae bacterium]|nr:CpsD/CapB family tyrosine-protein kinase [Kangiellaceae bacterium]
MSIIESAYLKDRKSKKGDLEEDASQMSDLPNQSAQSSIETRHVASKARNHIARMKQTKVYSKDELANLGIISKDLTNSKLMTEYRNLRTNLLASSESKNFVTLITSISPSFDSSLVTANIAAVFALDEGKTSVVVNADISTQKCDALFSVDPVHGLVDFIESDDLLIDKIIYETPINRLRYIPIGSRIESSAEYFSDTRMKKTMANIVSRYPERYIFVNAPSISSSADTRILLDICHKVILVVPYGIATEDNIRQAVLSIGSEKLSGIVLEEF